MKNITIGKDSLPVNQVDIKNHRVYSEFRFRVLWTTAMLMVIGFSVIAINGI